MPHFIFIQQISVLNIFNMLYNLHFFSSKCRLFHNATLFGFCITHILNTGCAKLWKKKSVAKSLKALYLEYKLPFRLNFDCQWKVFPVNVFLEHSVQALQQDSLFPIGQKSRANYLKTRVPSPLYLVYHWRDFLNIYTSHPPSIPYTRCKFPAIGQ